MRIDVEKLVYGGDGLARVNGEVILTPFVLPGELAEIELEPRRSGITRGSVREIARPSAHRVVPPCPYFGVCGGCHYQHASYEAQLAAKRTILAETLLRTGKLENIPEIAVISGEPWGYRNRIQLHFANGRVGYRMARSNKLCAIEKCPISSPKLNQCIAAINRMMRGRRWPAFLSNAELFTNETSVQFNVLETAKPIARKFFDWLAEEIPGLVTGALEYGGYRVSYGSFFQVNRFLIQQLIDTVVGDSHGETVSDLYSGVGLFTLPLMERFAKVTAVESGTGAIRDLAFNAERTAKPVHARAENVDVYLAGLEETPDLVVADPPRTGLGKGVVNRLVQLKPSEITLVACDPATLARDAQGLIASGYRLNKLTLVDLFPQTYHIETVAHFRLA